jgi:hypothetical protein
MPIVTPLDDRPGSGSLCPNFCLPVYPPTLADFDGPSNGCQPVDSRLLPACGGASPVVGQWARPPPLSPTWSMCSLRPYATEPLGGPCDQPHIACSGPYYNSFYGWPHAFYWGR